jgi:hypothetical protein
MKQVEDRARAIGCVQSCIVVQYCQQIESGFDNTTLEPDDRLTAALTKLHHDLFRYHFRLSQRVPTPSRAYHQERRRQDRHPHLRVIGHSLSAPKAPQTTMSK